MSLINEALRKARLEAARQDAASRGINYPTIERAPRRPPLAPILTAVVLLAIAGGLFYWLGTRSAQDGVEIGEASETATAAPAGLEPTLPEPVAGEAAAPAPVTTEPPATAMAPAPSSETGAAPREPAPVPAKTQPRPTPPALDPRPEPMAPAEPVTQPTPPAPIPADPVAVPVATEPQTAAPIEPPATPTRTPVTPETATIDPPPGPGPEAATPVSKTFVREASIPGVGQLRLGGIAWSERQPFALINGRVVGPGDRIQGLQVAAVSRGEVVLRAEGGARYVLRLR